MLTRHIEDYRPAPIKGEVRVSDTRARTRLDSNRSGTPAVDGVARIAHTRRRKHEHRTMVSYTGIVYLGMSVCRPRASRDGTAVACR